MEDVLNVNVDEEELIELLQEEEGDEWPEKGMNCPVPNCTSKDHHFQHLGNYKAHFDRFHKETIQLFSCPLCHVKDAKRSEITRHQRKQHKDKVMGQIPWKIVTNKKYVNPGSFKCPRKRIHREEREKARLERQRSLPREPLFTLNDDYNVRDHRYPDGGYKH